jgi:hypothetical protein
MDRKKLKWDSTLCMHTQSNTRFSYTCPSLYWQKFNKNQLLLKLHFHNAEGWMNLFSLGLKGTQKTVTHHQ